MATKKMKILVLGTNANGESDLYPCEVNCTKEQRENGDHHDIAMGMARDDDFDPKMAVDEDDGLWARLNPSGVYKKFSLDVVTEFQDTFMPGQQCDGAELVERLAARFQQFLTEDLPAAGEPAALVIAYTDEGYLDAPSGQCIDEGSPPQFTMVEDDIEKLRARSGAIVVELSPADIFYGAGELPTAQCLSLTAETAHGRSADYGFAITSENAAEAMYEELDLFGEPCPPPSFEPILVRAALAHTEKDCQTKRPSEGA